MSEFDVYAKMGENQERIEQLERSVAELSLQVEDLGKLVRQLQSNFLLIQKATLLTLSELPPAAPGQGNDKTPPPKQAIVDG